MIETGRSIIIAAAFVGSFSYVTTVEAGDPEKPDKESCDNGGAVVDLDADANCEIETGLDCKAKCDPLLLEAGCFVEAAATCEAQCGVDAALGCKADCSLGCEADCLLDAEVTCEATCTADCGVSCAAECQLGDLACLAECEAGCAADCNAACQADAKLWCAADCAAACVADCDIEAALECSASCEAELGAQCVADLEAKCHASCEANGAVFCDGAFVAGADVEPCIDELEEILTIDIEGDPNEAEKAYPESQGCSVAPRGPNWAGGMLGLLALMGLIVRRRK